MTNRRLYTEDSIRTLRPGTEIVLGKEALATPAALDLAFARGIRVRFEDGSVTPAMAAQASLWERMLRTDGEFIVQIQGGQPRVFRLTADGPVLFGEGAPS